MKKILVALFVLLIASCAFAEDYFEAGKKEFYKENYIKAEWLFKKALEQNPENYPCHYFLAHTYAYNDEVFKAKEEYSRVITFAPNKTLQKLAMQSMYNLNKSEKTTGKARVENVGDNYFNFVKMEDEYVKWERFPVNVYVVPSVHSDTIKRAFGTWQKVMDGKVSFSFVTSMDKAQIIARSLEELNVISNSTFEGGVAQVRVRNGYIYRSEVDVLSLNPIDKTPLPADAVSTVALHEIGHALGLQGHSPNKNDVMVAKDEPKGKNLTQRDINTMKMLYSKNLSKLNKKATRK